MIRKDSKRIGKKSIILCCLLFCITFTVPNSIYALVSHWTFDENIGVIAYDISNSNNGTIYNSVWVEGYSGSALSFTGNGYVEVSDSPGLNVGENYSVSFWINPTSLPTWQCLFERGLTADNRMGIWLNGDQITFETSNNGGDWWTSPSIIDVNQWAHIVALHDGASDTEQIYVNGNLIGNQVGRIVDNPNVGLLEIGKSAAFPSSYYFNGNIDDVRFYSKVLNQSEILGLYLTCNNQDTRVCGISNSGQCVLGVETCVNGQWGLCLGNIDPVSEICDDGLDNDCDERTDCDDYDCFDNMNCTTPYSINFVSPTPDDDSIVNDNVITVKASIEGTSKYSFIDWNSDVFLWLTMDTDTNGDIFDLSGKDRKIDLKGNISPLYGKFGFALQFDGIADYLQIYEEIDSSNLVTKYINNPILPPPAQFGSVWKDDQTIYLFYSNGAEIYVSKSPLSDGLNFSGETLILEAGSSEDYDAWISGANVWREDDVWYMFFRLRDNSYSNGFGYATCSAGPNCLTSPVFWDKATDNPINNLNGLLNNDYDPFGLIKIGTTYHLYSNPNPREINHYTSEDLINWQSDPFNPIFNTDRYCGYVFKHNSYYYIILPHDVQGFDITSGVIGDHSFELYRDTSPTFYPWEREYLGVIMLNNNWYDRYYIDTPSCLHDNIFRDTVSTGDELKCYYTGSEDAGWNQNFMSLSLSKINSLPARPEGYLHNTEKTFSAWINVSNAETPKSIFSIGDGKIDNKFQEVFYISQGRISLAWKTGENTEDILSGNSIIPLNQWTHVSYVYNGTSYKLYVNGVSDSSWKNGVPYYQKRNLYIGSGYNNDRYFNGSIDDVIIFNRALSDEEILNLYSADGHIENQFNILPNNTYTFKAHVVGWQGRINSTELRSLSTN